MNINRYIDTGAITLDELCKNWEEFSESLHPPFGGSNVQYSKESKTCEYCDSENPINRHHCTQCGAPIR